MTLPDPGCGTRSRKPSKTPWPRSTRSPRVPAQRSSDLVGTGRGRRGGLPACRDAANSAQISVGKNAQLPSELGGVHSRRPVAHCPLGRSRHEPVRDLSAVPDADPANGHRVRMPGGDHDREPEAPTRLCAMSRSTAPRSSATNPRRAPSRRRSLQPRPSRCPPPGSSMATSFGSRRLTARSTRCSAAGSARTGTASRVPGPQSGRRSGGQPPLHDRRQPDRLIQPGRRAAGEELVPGAARGGARLAPMPDIANAAARPFQVHRPCP